MQYLYGLFWTKADGTAMWALMRNGRLAIKVAKQGVEKVEIRRMPLPGKESRAWDAPTFRALSDFWKEI